MDFRTLVRVVTRHWIVVMCAIAVTAVVAVALALQIKPSYDASGSMLVLTQSSSTSEKGTTELNPLTNPGQVAAASTALVEVMMSDPYVERLVSEGVTGTYALTVPPNGSGAILGIKVVSASPEAALADYELLVGAVQDEVQALQRRANIPESTWIEAEELSTPARASVVSGGKVQVLAGALLLGVGASLSLAFAADMVYGENRRPLRRRGGDDSDEDGSDVDVADRIDVGRRSTWRSEATGRHALVEADDLEKADAGDGIGKEVGDPGGPPPLPGWQPKQSA